MLDRELIRTAMAQLIANHYGCYDAAVAQIAATCGGSPNRSFISQRLNGTRDFTLMEVMALEDGAGVYTITNMIARRKRKPRQLNISLPDMMASLAKESGEAIYAGLEVHSRFTPKSLAQAIIEAKEARQAASDTTDLLTALWASRNTQAAAAGP